MTDPLMRRYKVSMAALEPCHVSPSQRLRLGPPSNSSTPGGPLSPDIGISSFMAIVAKQRRRAIRQSSTGESPTSGSLSASDHLNSGSHSRMFSFRRLDREKRSKSFSDIRSTAGKFSPCPMIVLESCAVLHLANSSIRFLHRIFRLQQLLEL